MILKSKIQQPVLNHKHVSRLRLVERLAAFQGNFVLVSATAGTGKSSMVNEWLRQSDVVNIWYSIDAWDNDFQMFIRYIAAGISQVDHKVGQKAQDLIESFQSTGFIAFIRGLIVLLHQVDQPFTLILDDYHMIDNQEINQLIQGLIDHIPEQMKLIIITREDPDLQLSKLRLYGNMLDVRGHDLKFELEEAQSLLSQFQVKSIDANQLSKLMERTEGWIAGLQLAVMRLHEVEDVQTFIEEFSGNHTYLGDYLLEEVIGSLSNDTRDFILKVSLLEYFSSDLCDHILESRTSLKMIKSLEQANLFLVPMDSEGKWYRFHHLFRDLLKSHVSKAEIESKAIYLRAGQWFIDNGYIREAIHYYLAGQAYELAASFIETSWAEMDMQLQAASWLTMAKAIPEPEMMKRPVLAMAYGWALLDTGEVEPAVKWLNLSQDLLKKAQEQPEAYIVSDQEQFELMPATLASAYGYIAAGTGDIEGLFKHAYDALEKTPEAAYQKRSVIYMLLGFAHWSMGQLSEAESIIKDALKDVEKGVNALTRESFYMVLGELYIQQGRLIQGGTVLNQCLNRVNKNEDLPLLKASLHLGLAKTALYSGQMEVFSEQMDKSKHYGDRFAFMDWQYKYYKLMAVSYLMEEHYELALDALNEARQVYFLNPIPEYMSIDDLSYAIDLRRGQANRDLELVAKCQQIGQVPYMMAYRCSEIIYDALCKNEMTQELETIQTWLMEGARSQNILSNRVDQLVLQSRMLTKVDSSSLLQNAHNISKKEEYALAFWFYLSKDERTKVLGNHGVENQRHHINTQLDEPLTVRELEVLQLIVSGQSNKEIADTLFLAISTVKGYIQNIYGKLEVKRRTEAVAKARVLGL